MPPLPLAATPRAGLAFVLLAALAAGVCGTGCDGASPTSEGPRPLSDSGAPPLPKTRADDPRDILLISVDTLRPDHMSLYGYDRPTTPEIDRFFAGGQVYERAYAAEANTPPSVVSMLSGLYPDRHRVRAFFQRVGPEVHLLSDHLAAAGWQTAAVVSNFVLTTEATGLSTRFDRYDDFVTERELHRDVYERRASRTTDAAIAWLRDERDPDRPHLLWVHYIDPHAPYGPPAEESPRRFDDEGAPRALVPARIPPEARLPDANDVADYVDRYDEEIAYADQQIGRLLRHYLEAGLADDAIVVFTADHGEALAEHEIHFSHGYAVWEAILRVPLALRRPGAAPARIATPVSLVDLLPTLLGEVGLAVPEGLDGVSLDRRRPGDRLSLEATGWDGVHRRAIVQGDRKWYAKARGDRAVFDQRTTDLSTDPDERRLQNSAPGPNPALLETWFREDPDPGGLPESMNEGVRLDGPKVAPGRSERELEALRALGYVE